MKRAGIPVALVPTMGALHQGHYSLIRSARRTVGEQGVIVVSIYINPMQFGACEDLTSYPRNLKEDLAGCRREGVDLVFAPRDKAMYANCPGQAHSTVVIESDISRTMEGASRPEHFKGVTTVVCKLFMLTLPEFAVFGAKDYQQAAVIRRMAGNLNIPVKISVAPTVREKDGLAMSSRNIHLKPIQRQQAKVLHESIQEARKLLHGHQKHEINVRQLKKNIEKHIQRYDEARLDYLEFFDPNTFKTRNMIRTGTHMALAVYFGKTRLIDNGRL